MSSDAAWPAPLLDDRSREWFDACQNGRLLLQRCATCSHVQFYPRPHCVNCFGTQVDFFAASGEATLHTFTVVNKTANREFSPDCPYVLAIVDMDEGARVTSRVVDAALSEIDCGTRLRVNFRPAPGDFVLPVFVLAGAADVTDSEDDL
jgi:uncharacterized OB-fold protein